MSLQKITKHFELGCKEASEWHGCQYYSIIILQVTRYFRIVEVLQKCFGVSFRKWFCRLYITFKKWSLIIWRWPSTRNADNACVQKIKYLVRANLRRTFRRGSYLKSVVSRYFDGITEYHRVTAKFVLVWWARTIACFERANKTFIKDQRWVGKGPPLLKKMNDN